MVTRAPDVTPLYELRLSTPRLELRLGSRDELIALAHLAERGVHPPGDMPFAVPWTDRIGRDDFVESFVDFHEASLRDWRPELWVLNLLVWAEGELSGSQAVSAVEFAERREVETGSWLGQGFQRQGYGTEMRAAVLELSFCGLGAKVARSGAMAHNRASLRVGEKLGYRVSGSRTIAPRGEPVDHVDLALDRAGWRAPLPVEIDGLKPCLALFGAAPPTPGA
jgi:RimJ/RimL family protein N-acetyltransferase